MRARRASRNGPDASRMRDRPRGPVGPSSAIAEVEGRGTPNDSYLIFRSLSASPRFAPAPPFRASPPAPRVRIAPERSAFYRPKASALVGGRVSVPDLASVELLALPGQTRPAFSRSASSLDGGPALVPGGRRRLK